MLVPITINYLDTKNYGIWLTITSFVSWFSLFDIGLGNGLRNKFAEAKAIGNKTDVCAYVSTAYFTVGLISFFVFSIFCIINPFINWSTLLNTNSHLNEDLSLLVLIIFAFFTFQLTLKLIISIYQANQNHSIQYKVQFYTQLLSLFVILILTSLSYGDLFLFGSIFSSLPVIILIVFNLYGFKTIFKEFKPKYSMVSIAHLKGITGLGLKFFVLQISSLILFATDNFIIAKFFGPEEVVPYNISFKYFSIVIMLYTILVSPYWSSFTEAFEIKDYDWIKRNVKKIQKIWLTIPVLLSVMILSSNLIFKLWIGDEIEVPMSLNISMAIYVVILTYNMIYSSFINGVSKIKLNLVFSLISSIINIPLSIIFVKYLNLGSKGVILATCFCLLYALPFLPIQYTKIINGKAKGIWNK